MRINRTTVIGAMMSWLVDQPPPAVPAGQKPIRVHVAHSVFSRTHPDQMLVVVNGIVEGQYRDAASARKLLEEAVAWSEERNLYPEFPPSLIALADYKTGRLLPNGAIAANLNERSKLWGCGGSPSVQAAAKFREANLLGKWGTAIHTLTPADFRLADDGPARDLGPDVALVGPGAAYEKSKTTREYQEWRKKTAARLESSEP